MAQTYRLVERRNLGKDQAETPRKYYAQAVNNGYVSFDELCVEIAENCTLTSADVKAVMDRMNYTLDKHLKAGRIVQFGEIGNFRLSVGSSGSATAEDFSTSQMKKPKLFFHLVKSCNSPEITLHLRKLHQWLKPWNVTNHILNNPLTFTAYE